MTKHYQIQIDTWKQEIADILYHPTLVQYTGVPALSDLRMASLFLPLLVSKKTDKIDCYYATAIIYIALSSHDHVLQKGTLNKAQQLQVLAGDYYSGKYYQLLSEAGHIQLIKRLTESIRLMTEARTALMQENTLSKEEQQQAYQIIVTAPTLALYEELELLQYGKLAASLAIIDPQLEFAQPDSLLIQQENVLQLIEADKTLEEDLKDYMKSLIEAVLPHKTKL
ncbi:heptaprenyl diphosphate synthase component 1 [Chryseomicrobium sp. FSL W7-1435]|uniref:heptaprenyl diphosphate synthase component 1 n=1 Tax=Chryseomicrobium sp. FSL W7-1435 TaxID=2921704 RepID=UPI00315ADF85